MKTTEDKTALISSPGERPNDWVFEAIRAGYERGAMWHHENGSLELVEKASYDFADKMTAPSSPGKDGGQEVEAVGEAGEMPGSNGGFTMAAFKASDVPIGTKLYTRPQPDSTALVERLEAAEAALTQIANAFTAHTYSDAMDAVQTLKDIAKEALDAKR